MGKDLNFMVPHYETVHKFGGTSLATAKDMKKACELLPTSPCLIVVSAFGGVTERLDRTLQRALKKESFSPLLKDLKKKHLDYAEEIIPKNSQKNVLEEIEKFFEIATHVLTTISHIGSYSQAERAEVLGLGEKCSALIMASYLETKSPSKWLDASHVLHTCHRKGVESIHWTKSTNAFQDFLSKNPCDHLVITGFLACDEHGTKSLLERNGSDISASVFAEITKAKTLYIWTDRDGIFSADPRHVKNAFSWKSISYEEALELAYFGTSVIHPKSIAPAQRSGRDIYIKNTFKPELPGTLICKNAVPCDHAVRGITSIDKVALLTIEGTGLMGVCGVSSRAFIAMEQHKISVILISQASSEHSICFCVEEERGEEALKALKEAFAFEIHQEEISQISLEQNVSIVAAVGEGMVGRFGIAGRLCTTLAKAHVNIRAIAQGASECNISVVIESSDMIRAVQSLHAGFYLSQKTIVIGVIGVGGVGGEFLDQLRETQEELYQKENISLCVRALSNSKKMLTSDDTMDLTNWRHDLEHSKDAFDLIKLLGTMSQREFPHGVIIDCTASENLTKSYQNFIEKGYHIITPNKHLLSGELKQYKKIQELVQSTGGHFLYETTVCAGLPVIHTLKDILRTGDKVLNLSGVVSGSLSYIFTCLSKGMVFSEAVKSAKEKGYTEPDPREDLSGRDVSRKMVCLARELGHKAIMEEVTCFDLVPKDLVSESLDVFWQKLPQYDDEFTQKIKALKKPSQSLVYMGQINEKGKITVNMEAVSSHHPFSGLEGTDNMIIFKTKRYNEQPLIIRGPGAGTAVTAAGVFADLLRLVSYIEK